MSKDGTKDIAASTRAQLLKLAKERGENFDYILTKFGLERLLYRISQSEYQDRFVLKGAMLFVLWTDQAHRPTRDVDFLGFGDDSEDGLRAIFRDLCELSIEEDGLTLDPDSIQIDAIRDDTEYGGMRIKLQGYLAGAGVSIQADVGFGDAVTPEAEMVEYPCLLDQPAPTLRAYPRETVVAEKYQAMVNLGIANSRMKDFYDLWVIANQFSFEGDTITQAIKNTFERRETPLPTEPVTAFTEEFYKDEDKRTQWDAFVRKGQLMENPPSLEAVCLFLGTFLTPSTEALAGDQGFDFHWNPEGPWS